MRAAAMFLFAIAGAPAVALGDIYTCTDAAGRTVFRDAPCRSGEQFDASTALDSENEAAPKTKRRKAPGEAALNREQVERLVARLDKAMSKRDPKAVTALLAKDAVVEVQSTTAGKPAPMDRAAFSTYLSTAFARPDYVYEVQPARISMSKDKPRATVTRVVREAVPAAGQSSAVVKEWRERLNVEHDGRRALIHKLRKVVVGAEKRV